jgi:hypothetical protein
MPPKRPEAAGSGVSDVEHVDAGSRHRHSGLAAARLVELGDGSELVGGGSNPSPSGAAPDPRHPERGAPLGARISAVLGREADRRG